MRSSDQKVKHILDLTSKCAGADSTEQKQILSTSFKS